MMLQGFQIERIDRRREAPRRFVYGYDELGRIERVALDGETATIRYDTAGQIVGIEAPTPFIFSDTEALTDTAFAQDASLQERLKRRGVVIHPVVFSRGEDFAYQEVFFRITDPGRFNAGWATIIRINEEGKVLDFPDVADMVGGDGVFSYHADATGTVLAVLVASVEEGDSWVVDVSVEPSFNGSRFFLQAERLGEFAIREEDALDPGFLQGWSGLGILLHSLGPLGRREMDVVPSGDDPHGNYAFQPGPSPGFPAGPLPPNDAPDMCPGPLPPRCEPEEPPECETRRLMPFGLWRVVSRRQEGFYDLVGGGIIGAQLRCAYESIDDRPIRRITREQRRTLNLTVCRSECGTTRRLFFGIEERQADYRCPEEVVLTRFPVQIDSCQGNLDTNQASEGQLGCTRVSTNP